MAKKKIYAELHTNGRPSEVFDLGYAILTDGKVSADKYKRLYRQVRNEITIYKGQWVELVTEDGDKLQHTGVLWEEV